jgi:hypothetical protein
MVYDGESGLVYNETVQRPCDCFRRAAKRLNESSVHCRTFPSSSSTPARKLQAIVERRLLANLNLLNAKSLEGVPRHILQRLWDTINENGKPGLQTRTIFDAALDLPAAEKFHRWSWYCSRGTCQHISDVFRLIDSPQWLTKVNIDGYHAVHANLHQVSSLRNLSHIRVRQHGHCVVDDRVLSSWARAAREEGALPSLKTIELRQPCSRDLWDDGPLITPVAFELAGYLPRLEHFAFFASSSRLQHHLTGLGRQCGGFNRAFQGTCRHCQTSTSMPEGLLVIVDIGDAERDSEGDKKVCFERNWSWKLEAKRSGESGPRVTKRRRLRGGKSTKINDMLSSL